MNFPTYRPLVVTPPPRETDTVRIGGIDVDVARGWTVGFGDGHSGHGWYAWCIEYPEDGSVFLGGDAAAARRVAVLLPAGDA
jgi:hypothetical protein